MSHPHVCLSAWTGRKFSPPFHAVLPSPQRTLTEGPESRSDGISLVMSTDNTWGITHVAVCDTIRYNDLQTTLVPRSSSSCLNRGKQLETSVGEGAGGGGFCRKGITSFTRLTCMNLLLRVCLEAREIVFFSILLFKVVDEWVGTFKFQFEEVQSCSLP